MANNNASSTIAGPVLPNIPWEDRPAGCHDVVWRSTRNPIIPRDLIPYANSIFNSAVVPFNGEYAGVFRVDNRKREMRMHSGRSKDAVHWEIEGEPSNLVQRLSRSDHWRRIYPRF